MAVLDLNLNPDDRTLRQFGFIALVGFGALAACAWYEAWLFSFGLGGAREVVAGVFGALAVLSVLFSLVYPRANRVIFVGTAVAAYPIGFVLSYAIMGLLFFGIFAPMGMMLKLFGKDPMNRELRTDAESYWSKARPPRDKDSYLRQF